MHLAAVAGVAQQLSVCPGVGASSRERLDVIKASPSVSLHWLEFAWRSWINGCLVAKAAVAAFCLPDGVGGQVFIACALRLSAALCVA
jgi:hypothetical protein